MHDDKTCNEECGMLQRHGNSGAHVQGGRQLLGACVQVDNSIQALEACC